MASLMGVMAFIQPLLHAVFPAELRLAAARRCDRIVAFFLPYCYFDITEIDGVNTNELYNAVRLYLSSFASATGSRLTLSRQPNSSSFTFGISNNDRILDTFSSASVAWEHVVTQRPSQSFSFRPVPDEKRGFTLRIRKKDKALVLDAYLDHIMARSAEIRRSSQDRRLYTNSRGGSLDSRGQPWECVPFKHPSTFEFEYIKFEFRAKLSRTLLGSSSSLFNELSILSLSIFFSTKLTSTSSSRIEPNANDCEQV